MIRAALSACVAIAMCVVLIPSRSAAAEAPPAEPRALFEAANAAYYQGDYALARSQLGQLVESFQLEDPAVYHNLGNAHFRLGDYGAAILYYRRGLRLEPGGELAQSLERNLDTARRVLQSRYRASSESALIYSDPIDVAWQIAHLMSADALAILFGVCWVLLFGLLIARRLQPSPARVAARLAVFPGVALLLAGALVAMRLATDASHVVGVVVVADAQLRDGPHPDAQGKAVPEGLEVRLVGDVEGWVQVELAGGRRGWVKAAAVKQI